MYAFHGMLCACSSSTSVVAEYGFPTGSPWLEPEIKLDVVVLTGVLDRVPVGGRPVLLARVLMYGALLSCR